MPTPIPPCPSRRFTALIHAQAWTDTTVLDLINDFLDAHPAEAETILAYVNARAALTDGDGEDGNDGEPKPAPPGQSVDDLDALYGIQRAASGDLLDFKEVKDRPANHVWTITEGDDGSLWACAGFHIVNKLGYVTTERPWNTADEAFRFDD